jgi:hypothetical protein
MRRRHFGPRFGAVALTVLAACSGEKFGEAPGQSADGGAGDAAEGPRNSTDNGTLGHGLDDPSVIPQGGTTDAGAGGNDSGGVAVAGGVGGDASGGVAVAGGAGGNGGAPARDIGDIYDGGDNAGGNGGAVAICLDPIVEDWSAPLGESERWSIAWGDPYVDSQYHRLVVTRDDVATRNAAFKGGYYATAQITVNGYVPLAVYPFAKQGVWPSLRLDAAGDLELGGTIYGETEVWHNQGWPNQHGAVISGTHTASVTFYVKAGAQAAAAKVRHDGKVWRSGWVTGPFIWPDTNLGIFRYVGQNNSYANETSEETIYVGRVSGCQGLSDDEIQAKFDN